MIEPIHLAALLMAVAAALMLLLEGGGLGALRNAVGYFSIFLISIVATHAMRTDPARVARFIDMSLAVWLVVGLIQRTVSKSALTFLVFSARTSETRGVISLAAEPTFFATMVLMMVMWRAIFGIRLWHLLAVFLTTLVLAGSSQILIVLLLTSGITTLCLLLDRKYFAWAIAIIAVGAAALGVVAFFLADTRLGSLVKLAAENPKLVLLSDASANQRFVHIFAGLRSAIDHNLLPSGLLTQPWVDYIASVISRYPDIFWTPQPGDRILSAAGAIVFQMGLLAIPLAVAILIAVFKWRAPHVYRLAWISAFTLLMLTALPLSHPMIGVLIGALAFVGRPGELPQSRKLLSEEATVQFV